jgi:hypothetical protein
MLRLKRAKGKMEYPASAELAYAEGIAYYIPVMKSCRRNGDTCRHNAGWPSKPTCQHTAYFTVSRTPICCAYDDANEVYAAMKAVGEPITTEQMREQGKDYYYVPSPGKYCGHIGMLTENGRCYTCEQEKRNARMRPSTKPLSPRQLALAAGEKWYMPSGNDPCRNGHISRRSVANGECEQCIAERPKPVKPAVVIRDEDTIISRDAARSKGLKHYRTGDPCRAGHAGWRYVSTGNCITCMGR